MNGALNGTANEIEPISFAVVFNWEYIYNIWPYSSADGTSAEAPTGPWYQNIDLILTELYLSTVKKAAKFAVKVASIKTIKSQ